MVQALFTSEEFSQLHAAITDIAMTVKQLRKMTDDHDLILRDMWRDLDAVKRATVPPKKVAPSIQREAGQG